MSEKEQDELEFLRWFWGAADFGPADGDVRYIMMEEYEKTVGPLPEGYQKETL